MAVWALFSLAVIWTIFAGVAIANGMAMGEAGYYIWTYISSKLPKERFGTIISGIWEFLKVRFVASNVWIKRVFPQEIFPIRVVNNSITVHQHAKRDRTKKSKFKVTLTLTWTRFGPSRSQMKLSVFESKELASYDADGLALQFNMNSKAFKLRGEYLVSSQPDGSCEYSFQPSSPAGYIFFAFSTVSGQSLFRTKPKAFTYRLPIYLFTCESTSSLAKEDLKHSRKCSRAGQAFIDLCKYMKLASKESKDSIRGLNYSALALINTEARYRAKAFELIKEISTIPSLCPDIGTDEKLAQSCIISFNEIEAKGTIGRDEMEYLKS
ncbi:hypothetical protein AAMO2058_001587900, partial [Amorphochlora amoebiformis]